MVDGEQADGHGERQIVVVPHRPGPLVPLDGGPPAGRSPDDLDLLIDDLFPDTEEGPGWFDLGLAAVGVGLLVWGGLAGGPGWAAGVGVVVLALGAILPLRWAWRTVAARRHARRRSALLALGVPLDVSVASTARLAAAHAGALDGLPPADPAVAVARAAAHAAAHAAVLEAASLLGGSPPSGPDEQAYVDVRSAAIESLTAALGARRPAAAAAGPDASLVLKARAELDALTGTCALTRIEDLTAEARRADAAGGGASGEPGP
jgi:hypothetical protein